LPLAFLTRPDDNLANLRLPVFPGALTSLAGKEAISSAQYSIPLSNR
jgi:hypothetical protein